MLTTDEINQIQSLLRKEMRDTTDSIQACYHAISEELMQNWIDRVHRLEVIHDKLNKMRSED